MFSALALALLSTVTAAPAVVESPFGLITTLGNEKIYDDFVVTARKDGTLWLGQQVQLDTPAMLGAMDITGRVQPFDGASLYVSSDGSLRVAGDNKGTEFIINEASHLQDAEGNISMSGCPVGDTFQVFTGHADCDGRIDFALTAVTDNAMPLTKLATGLDVKQNFCCLKSCFKCGGCSSHARPSGCAGGCAPASAPVHAPSPVYACPPRPTAPAPIPTCVHTPPPSPPTAPAPVPHCNCQGDKHEAPCIHHNKQCSACPKDQICGLCGHVPCPKNILCNLCNVRPCVCPKDTSCVKCKSKRCICLKDFFCNECNSNDCSCGPPRNHGPTFNGPSGPSFGHHTFGPSYNGNINGNGFCRTCGNSPCTCSFPPTPPPSSNWDNGNGNGGKNGNNDMNNRNGNGNGNGSSFCNNCGSSPCGCNTIPPPPTNWGSNNGNGNDNGMNSGMNKGNGNGNSFGTCYNCGSSPCSCSNNGNGSGKNDGNGVWIPHKGGNNGYDGHNWNNGQNCNTCGGPSPCACLGSKLACAASKLKNFCPGKALCMGCNQCC